MNEKRNNNYKISAIIRRYNANGKKKKSMFIITLNINAKINTFSEN